VDGDANEAGDVERAVIGAGEDAGRVYFVTRGALGRGVRGVFERSAVGSGAVAGLRGEQCGEWLDKSVLGSKAGAGVMYINNKNIKARRMKRRGDCPTVRSKHADVTERVNERFARDGYGVSGVLEGLEPGRRSLEEDDGALVGGVVGDQEEAKNGVCRQVSEGECVDLYEDETQSRMEHAGGGGVGWRSWPK
jgi:hypothetical protein